MIAYALLVFSLLLLLALWCWREYQLLSSASLLTAPATLQRRSRRNLAALGATLAMLALGGLGVTVYHRLGDDSVPESSLPELPVQPVQQEISPPPSAENDLFEPTDDAALPSVLDHVKQKYEETLVTYFFMRRCGVATPQEFHLINSALMHELALLKGPASLQQSILNAAQGSYNELYIRSSCSDPGSRILIEQYRSYIRQLLTATPNP